MPYTINVNTTVIDNSQNVSLNEVSASGFFLFNPNVGYYNGYTSGGITTGGITQSSIDRFAFTSDLSNATNIGNLTSQRSYHAGQSSTTHGYASGGTDPTTVNGNIIERFSFFSDTSNAVDVGDLVTGRYRTVGQSSSTHGYISGGATFNGTSDTSLNIIERFPFASSITNAASVGILSINRARPAAFSSRTHGYTVFGFNTSTLNSFDRFSFASGTENALSVGTTSIGPVWGASGFNNQENGYVAGGGSGTTLFAATSSFILRIQSSSETATTVNVGYLNFTRIYSASQSSLTYGYMSGGTFDGSTIYNNVERFFFASNLSTFDVGDLTAVRYGTAGHQY